MNECVSMDECDAPNCFCRLMSTVKLVFKFPNGKTEYEYARLCANHSKFYWNKDEISIKFEHPTEMSPNRYTAHGKIYLDKVIISDLKFEMNTYVVDGRTYIDFLSWGPAPERMIKGMTRLGQRVLDKYHVYLAEQCPKVK